jgi:DNA-binding ferritin-like protein
MNDPAVELRRAASDYQAALEKIAQIQEGLASELASLADELDRQGQPETADMLLQASHYHRASSIRSRAVAAVLDTAD